MDYIESISLTSIVIVILLILYVILNIINKALIIGGLCLVLFLSFKFGIKYNTQVSGALAIFVCVIFNLFFINYAPEQFSVNEIEMEEPEVISEEKPEKPSNEDDEEVEEVEDFQEDTADVDLSATFLDAYKALTPDQINSMTKDARELLKTQKSLMATMKEMAPVVEEGRKMMSQFGGYFGTKSVDSLAKTVRDFTKEQKK